jgi:hypothetical protein
MSIEDSEYQQSAKAFPNQFIPFFAGVRRYVEEQVQLDIK